MGYRSTFLWRATFRKRVLPVLVRYGSALAVVAVAILLRLWLNPLLERAGFAIFLTGMLAAAWVGGLGPCLIAQTLILFAEAVWFSPTHRVHSPVSLQGIVSLVAFYSVGGIVAILSEAWHVSRQRMRLQSEEAIAQRERLRTVLCCMGDGVLVTDADGCLTLMNPTAEAMTGWTLAESKGKPACDVFRICDDQNQKMVENPVQRVVREQRVLHETMRFVLTTRTDQRLPVSYSAAPIYDSRQQVEGVVLVVRDETNRRRTERALRDADRRKDEFLATLAHELRNPLAPICMGLDLMKASSDDQQVIDNVRSMMERQAQHMVRLIDDLLDVSRITRGKLELRRSQVAIADVVRNAVDAARPAIEGAEHHLMIKIPDTPVLLYADCNRLTQVLSNLLDNAAKYTPSGGRIELNADIHELNIEITISDNGCGISADKLESIFDMFMQVRGKLESGHKGLGIGLTLVKQLVHLHGGSVEVESDGLNRGSRFRVRLPVVAPVHEPQLPMQPVSANPPSIAPRRVLVVDDNADALKTLSMLASLLGNVTYQARDGFEAIEAAEQFRPDVVLMDIGMPNLNGYEAARQLRKEDWGQDMTLVAITGWGQEEDRRRTLEAGFDYHLVKPIAPAQLQELLATVSSQPISVDSQEHESFNGPLEHSDSNPQEYVTSAFSTNGSKPK